MAVVLGRECRVGAAQVVAQGAHGYFAVAGVGGHQRDGFHHKAGTQFHRRLAGFGAFGCGVAFIAAGLFFADPFEEVVAGVAQGIRSFGFVSAP